MEMMGYGVAEVLIPKENNIIKKSLTLLITFVRKTAHLLKKLTATKIMKKLLVIYKLISLVIVLGVGILTCNEERA